MSAKTSDWRPGPTVCRCCFADGCYKDISTEYFWMGKREVYSEMLTETFSVSIGYQSAGPNSNSRLICEACIARLRDASDFKRQVQECEKTFMQHLDPSGSLDDMILESEREVKLETETVKLKDEKHSDDDYDDASFGIDDMDDDDDDLDDQPLTAFKAKVPKKEVVEIIETAKPEKRKAPTKLKVSPAKKLKKKEAPKPAPSKAPVTEKKDKKKGVLKMGIATGKEVKITWKSSMPIKLNKKLRSLALILECSNAIRFKWKSGCFVCAVCSDSFAEFGKLKEHMASHKDKGIPKLHKEGGDPIFKVDISNLQCSLCPKDMENLEQLKKHLTDEHGKSFSEGISDDDDHRLVPYRLDTDKLSCVYCGKEYQLFYSLNTHMNEHFPRRICAHCGKGFKRIMNYESHMLSHTPNAAPPGGFNCNKCKLTFPTSLLRSRHLNQMHRNSIHKCPYCKESFKYYTTRVKHMKEHHNVKIEYACELCPAKFSLHHARTKHIRRMHLKEKNFACDVCSDVFATKAELQGHAVKHTGEKNFVCDVCSKAFSRRKTLVEHKRIHSNDRRHRCEYCSYTCVQKVCLKGHVKTHHSDVNSKAE